MRTLIISDLHLGSASRCDLLRSAGPRESLLALLEGVDRLVLLGDVLELRDSPTRQAMLVARPFFEDVGRELAAGEVVIVAGNHDHALVASWLARQRQTGQPGALGLEQRLAVSASPTLAALSRWVTPARLVVSYPGMWVRDDVYATHGHYLDCHAGVTSGERLMIAAVSRLSRRAPVYPLSVVDYEAITGPVYVKLDRLAILRRLAYSRPAARLGRLLAGLPGDKLTRAERNAMGEVAARLQLGNASVVFGHTHRAGPLSGGDESQWRGRLGARLINCGSWLGSSGLSDSAQVGDARFIGSYVVVEDSGPPVLTMLDGPLSSASQSAIGAE